MRKMRNGKKGDYSELVFAAIACGAASLFGFFIFFILEKSGAIVFNMPFGAAFCAFAFVCVFALGFFLFYLRFKKNRESLESIYEAVDKISSGDYEVYLDDVSARFRRVAQALEAVALALKRSEETKNDFINDFSHELKTPIVSIRGFAKLIAKGQVTKEEEKEYLDVIVSESDRLIDLTASTLMLDRLSNERLDVVYSEFDLSETLRKCILVLQSAWEKKNIEVETDAGDCRIDSNEELMSQLFINILDNAVKFTPEGGKVEVKLVETNKEAIVKIKDNGIGMDEETRRRMYDKYFRAEKSRTSHGNGLGLATVKRIAELLDLKIDVVSAPGEGAEFTVTHKKKK